MSAATVGADDSFTTINLRFSYAIRTPYSVDSLDAEEEDEDDDEEEDEDDDEDVPVVDFDVGSSAFLIPYANSLYHGIVDAEDVVSSSLSSDCAFEDFPDTDSELLTWTDTSPGKTKPRRSRACAVT